MILTKRQRKDSSLQLEQKKKKKTEKLKTNYFTLLIRTIDSLYGVCVQPFLMN